MQVVNLTACHTTGSSASIFTTTTATASQQSTGLSGVIDTAKTISNCSYEHESKSWFPKRIIGWDQQLSFIIMMREKKESFTVRLETMGPFPAILPRLTLKGPWGSYFFG